MTDLAACIRADELNVDVEVLPDGSVRFAAVTVPDDEEEVDR